MNADGSTTTGGYLWNSTDMTQAGYLGANPGAKASDYNQYMANQNASTANAIGGINSAVGLAGLGVNAYYAHEKLKAENAQTRRMNKLQDRQLAKQDEFQRRARASGNR